MFSILDTKRWEEEKRREGNRREKADRDYFSFVTKIFFLYKQTLIADHERKREIELDFLLKYFFLQTRTNR